VSHYPEGKEEKVYYFHYFSSKAMPARCWVISSFTVQRPFHLEYVRQRKNKQAQKMPGSNSSVRLP
jgi:hypothetical protein